MSEAPQVPQLTLADGSRIPRLIKGGWQLAGGHGAVNEAQAIADMFAFANAGITAFDCADIYTGVEELIGKFLRAWHEWHGPNAPHVRIHTKCVPDLDALSTLTRADLEATVDRSLRRLGMERLDLVQFHWWDFGIPGYVEAALHLTEMQRAGKIAQLGVTNFDTPHLLELLDAGVPVVAHQLQCSLLDRRALGPMGALCTERHVRLLAYGALAGGFLHERWLGAPAPDEPLENRSLVKYRLIIDEFGGWEIFQRLLAELGRIAGRHDTSIGSVALRWVLDQTPVAAVIIGARSAEHLPATLAALGVSLATEDRAALNAILAECDGPRGDVYALERQKAGPHAAIMRYNLNRQRP